MCTNDIIMDWYFYVFLYIIDFVQMYTKRHHQPLADDAFFWRPITGNNKQLHVISGSYHVLLPAQRI